LNSCPTTSCSPIRASSMQSSPWTRFWPCKANKRSGAYAPLLFVYYNRYGHAWFYRKS
jgi:hypothetical protein